jgi:pimeloyl-ACP methyl ester carboxylesterase
MTSSLQLTSAPLAPASTRTQRGPLARIVGGALAIGVIGAALVVVVLLPGAAEHVTTGGVLLAFAAGWATLAVLTTRLTTMPQRWAYIPATAMGLTGTALIVLAPGDDALQTAGFVWPPLLLVLSGWMLVQVRRAMRSRVRWLLYPVLAALALSSVGGLAQTLAENSLRTGAAPGRVVDVDGGHQLHLQCVGSGSPTVVLNNSLGGSSAAWTRVLDAAALTTRVCAYDRAGQGWSEPAEEPQDSAAVVADLHRLLEHAGEKGPFVLAGHSAGGAYAMAYAARHPDDTAGLALLDSMTPEQFTVLPDYPGQYSALRRLYGVAPSLTRIGVGQLARALTTAEPPGEAGEQALAVAVSPRNWRTARDELSTYRRALAQAGELTTIGAKPLVVLSATETLEGTSGWRAAQAELATLSSNTSARTVTSTHADLLTDQAAAEQVTEAILAIVEAVRTRSALRAPATTP